VYHFNVDTHAGQVTPWPAGGRRGVRRTRPPAGEPAGPGPGAAGSWPFGRRFG